MKRFLKFIFISTALAVFIYSLFTLFTLNPDIPLDVFISRTRRALLLLTVSGGAIIGYVVLR